MPNRTKRMNPRSTALRRVLGAVACAPLSLGAVAYAATPAAPRLLDWGNYADDGARGGQAPVEAPKPTPRPAPPPPAPPPSSVAAPAAEGARVFFERMVKQALALSPEVREASARWQATEHDIEQAKGQRWPQVQFGLASPSATFGNGTNDSARNAIGAVSITTPLYDWGRINSTIGSRTETAKATYQELEQAREKVAFDTVSALVELRRNERLLALSQAYVKRMTELVEMLGEIVRSDRGRASELTQARARRLQAMATRDLALSKLREIQVGLVRLVGVEVQLPPQVRWDVQAVDLQEAQAAAPEHPLLQQARAEARAATLHADSVRASRWPQLNWVIAKTTQEDSFGNRQPWATGLSLQWSLFQGGSGAASERAAFERALASEEKALAASRDLDFRLRTAAEQRDAALGRASEYLELIAESDQVRRMFFEQWHHLGTRTLLDVLIAENDFFNNQVAQANSLVDGEAADLRMRSDAGILLSWLGDPGYGAPAPKGDAR